jgi:hypothetical protein
MDELPADELSLPSGYTLELMPDAAAPSLTRFRVKHTGPHGHVLALAEVALTTHDLEELARLCTAHVEQARPHVLAAIDAACSGGGQAREWL